MSYLDQVDIGVVACPQLTPDAGEIPAHLEAALDELIALAT